MLLRSLGIVVALPLMMFWGWFAVATWPLIVGSDHDPVIVRAQGHATFAGIALFIVTALSILLSAGAFGRGSVCGVIALALTGTLLGAAVWMHPASKLQPHGLSQWVLPAQLVGVAVVVIGATDILRAARNEAKEPRTK